MKFGDYLRNCRERLNWTQPEAAKHIDIEQSYLSKLETGKSYPSEDIFDRLVSVYNIELNDLYADIQTEELEKLKHLKQIRDIIVKKSQQEQSDVRNWLIAGLVMLVIGGASLGHALIPSQHTVEYLYRSEGELKIDEPLDTYEIMHQSFPDKPMFAEKIAQQKALLPRIHQLEHRTYDDRGSAYVKKTLDGRRYYKRVGSQPVERYSGHKWFLIPACAFLLGSFGSFYISRRWK